MIDKPNATHRDTDTPVEIRNWEPAFREAFFQLNKAWIEVDYPLEPLDIAVLSNPEDHILNKGGAILAALIGTEVVGVVALRPFADNSMELTTHDSRLT